MPKSPLIPTEEVPTAPEQAVVAPVTHTRMGEVIEEKTKALQEKIALLRQRKEEGMDTLLKRAESELAELNAEREKHKSQ